MATKTGPLKATIEKHSCAVKDVRSRATPPLSVYRGSRAEAVLGLEKEGVERGANIRFAYCIMVNSPFYSITFDVPQYRTIYDDT